MEKVIMLTGRTEKGFSCSCDLLPGWVVAQSGSFHQFREYVEESIDFYIEAAKEDNIGYPKVFDGEYELIFKFDVQSLLQTYRGVFSLAALENITGIHQKQLEHYAAGRSKPRPKQAERVARGLKTLAEELTAVTV